MCAHSVRSDPYAGFYSFLENESKIFQELRYPPQDLFRTFFGEGHFASAEKVKKDLPQSPFERVCIDESITLSRFKKDVISGYLNLGNKDGWTEGSDPRIGVSFTRYILFKYFVQNKKQLGSNAVVIEKVVNAFKSCKNFLNYPFSQVEASHKPETSRICYDSTVGWQDHAISRLVGNLGTVYSPSKPFFEILINSARHSEKDSSCRPFFISVHANEEELEKRRKNLVALASAPFEASQFLVYSPCLQKPDAFLKKFPDKLGLNSTRLLKALAYLQKVTINAQEVGNCWIKQPMRGLLASLYVELITHRDTLSPESAWTEATRLYKSIQKTIAIPYVKELIDHSDATAEMKRVALVSLEKQKQL